MSESNVADSEKLQWNDELSIQCDGVVLQLTPGMRASPSTDEVITLFKDPGLVRNYIECLRGRDIRNMMEIGIRDGGSAIFFWHLLELNKLCCVELNTSAPTLTRYIENQNLTKNIHTHFGVDQADKSLLAAIVAEDFPTEPIDLVVDDASHVYSPSLATFELLFPLVRPGGLYILEDWRASLLAVVRRKSGEAEPALDRLVHEILSFATVNPHIIPSVNCNKNFVVVERGEGHLPKEGFSLANIEEYFVPAKNRPA